MLYSMTNRNLMNLMLNQNTTTGLGPEKVSFIYFNYFYVARDFPSFLLLGSTHSQMNTPSTGITDPVDQSNVQQKRNPTLKSTKRNADELNAQQFLDILDQALQVPVPENWIVLIAEAKEKIKRSSEYKRMKFS